MNNTTTGRRISWIRGFGVGRVPAGALALALLAAACLCAGGAEARRRVHISHHHGYSRPAASMVVDGRTGKILHANNVDAQRHPASLTKIMTLHLLFEQLRAGRVTMSTELKVSAKASDQAPSKLNLSEGDVITVKDAIRALVTKSANDVAVVIAENLAGSESAFARAMTDKAKALGMSRTVYRNASGLPNDEQTTTARDQIILTQQTLRAFPEYSKVFQTRFFQYKGRVHRNHNGLLFTYSGVEGMKTGYTQAAGFNLVITAHRGGRHLIAVVLGGRTASARNEAMRALLDASWAGATPASGSAEPVIASAAAPAGEEAEDIPAGVPDLPEPNPAFHASPEETRVQAQILASMSRFRPAGEAGPPAARALPITAVLAGVAPQTTGAALGPAALGGDAPSGPEERAEERSMPAAQVARASVAASVSSDVMENGVTEIVKTGAASLRPAVRPEPSQAVAAAPAAPAKGAAGHRMEGAWARAWGEAATPQAEEADPAQAPAPQAAPTQVAAATPAVVPAPSAAPAPAIGPQFGPFHVQVGSYYDGPSAEARLAEVKAAAASVVKGHPAFTAAVQISGKDVYRARYGSFSEKDALAACVAIRKRKLDCMVVRAD